MSRWAGAASALRVHARSIRCADERYARNLAGRRRGRAPLSADPRPRQTGRDLRRHLPHHRHHALQLRQLRHCAASYILTQYKALSLNRQIREGWNIFGREIGEFIEILPPMQRVSENWYMGTADAVYQNIYSIGSRAAQVRDHPRRRPHLQNELRAHAASSTRTRAPMLPSPP